MPDSDRMERTDQRSRSISRRDWLRASGVGSVTALAGCLLGSGDDDGVIEYWRWPHSTDPSNTGEDEIVQAFNEGPGADMGIEVEQVTNPFGDHEQAVRTAIGGGDAPDVAWTFPADLHDYTGQSREDIEEDAPFVYIEDYIDDDFRNQFFDPAWEWQEQRYGGLIGVPFISGLRPGLMYVNVDAWNEAGLGDLPEDSWSYEEYLDAVEALHGTEVNGSEVRGAGVATADLVSNGEWYNYATRLSRTAGSLIGGGYQNEDGEYVMTLASDAEVEAWNAIAGEPIANGWTNNPGAYEWIELQDPFASGQIGIMHHLTYTRVELAEQADFEWEIVPYPTKDGEENFGIYSASSMDITMNAFREEVGGNPEDAMEFIKFRNNAENQYKWFNLSSQAVPNQAAYEKMQEEGLSDFVEQSRGLELMDRVADAMEQHAVQQEAIQERYPDVGLTESGVPITDVPRGAGSGQVHDAVGGMHQRLANNGNSDPESAFTEAEEAWANVLAEEEDAAVDEDSIGYNSPEPQSGPL